MKRLLLLVPFFISISALAELHFTYCDPATKELKVKNYGVSAIDISNYRLCSSFVYKVLNSGTGITILSGDFNLGAGEEVHFSWTDSGGGFSDNMDDMGLYISANFSDPNSMVDFIEWGAGDQGREDVAVSAGIWTEDVFVPTPGPFYYIGDGQLNGPAQWSQSPPGGDVYTGVRINEIDPDQPSADAGEFVELFGDPNASLDGLVVVFFQGAQNDVAYAAFDLDGYSLDANGFFVLGNANVPSVQLTFADNSLQNGEDGIAIYVGDATSWSASEVAVSENLVDAAVYGTEDPDDVTLLAILTPGQPQLDDLANSTTSFSRVPDGGEAFATTTYVVQDITPGYSNVPACQGASVTVVSGNVEQCTEDDNAPIQVSTTSQFGDFYIYILTDVNDAVISYNTDGIFEMDTEGEGEFHIYGFAYNGLLNEATVSFGSPVSGASAGDCSSLSLDNVIITRTLCSAPTCDGGSVTGVNGETYYSVCADETEDLISFENTSVGDVGYAYFLIDSDLNIVQEITEPALDANALAVGTYYLAGVSFDGTLNPDSIEVGDPFDGISNVGGTCISNSISNLQIDVTTCIVLEGCTELYFSEYIEGTANNKAIEIYNPTPFPANLDDYDVLGYFNGSVSPGPVIALSGTLAPGETYLIVNSQAQPSLLNLADVTGGIATFNGNDALVLAHNLVPIDVIGTVGEDPITNWTFGTGATSNMTLVRNSAVTAPTTNWVQSQGQWIIQPIDDFSNAGSHATFPCSDIAFIGFTEIAQSVEESVGSVTVTVQSFNVSTPVEVTIDLTDATATLVDDFQNVFPITLTFDSENTLQSFTIDIVDDELLEVYEYFSMNMIVDPELATLVIDEQTITIEPSDQSYPLYTIEQITAQSGNQGIADSLGVFCTIAGIVHGINFNGDGIHFTLIENSAGIKIFDANDNFGYTVEEGDSVRVKGEVTQFYGMTEFFPDSIFFVDGGHPLEVPQYMTSPLGEEQESRMVRFECLELVDESQWTNELNGFFVDVTDGTNVFAMFIDLDTDIYGTDAPSGHFSVTGIGAQFDTTGSPYNEGYNFWPRYLEDFYDELTASFIQFGDIVYGDEGVTIDFINTSVGGTNLSWDFGDGTSGTEQFPSKFYSYDFLSNVAEVTISLTVDNEDGCSDTFTYTTDAVYVGVSEIENAEIQMYPNPASDIIHIRATDSIESIDLADATGRIVWSLNNAGGLLADVDVSRLPAGLYQVRIATSKNSSTQKLMVR
ncbi:MAG: lamin tail domain-containing protein [Flavobacteriales bacterium]